jgi:hypothetical protein
MCWRSGLIDKASFTGEIRIVQTSVSVTLQYNIYLEPWHGPVDARVNTIQHSSGLGLLLPCWCEIYLGYLGPSDLVAPQ